GVLRVLAKLADGLAHAHERGILHLDLKPANVLLADDGEPMLLDFNLAFDATSHDRGLVGGTVPYMAIEQLIDLKSRGKGEIDVRTDLYSLGVMAYEMLTGVAPFPATGLCDIDSLIADRRQRCHSVRAVNPLVSPAIEAIVKKLLAPEPKDRYQSAVALRTDLERHLNNLPLESVREPSFRERFRKWRRRNPGVLIRLMLAVIFGLLIGLAGATYKHAESNARAAATERVRITRLGLERIRLDLVLPIDPALRRSGIEKATDVLNAYGLPDDQHWMERQNIRRLSDGDRAALAGDLGELLLLMAQAKWRDVEYRQNPVRSEGAREALKANRAARLCFSPESTPAFLHRQAAELAKAAGEDAEPYSSSPGGKRRTSRDTFLDACVAVSTGRFTSAIPLLDSVVTEQPGHASAQFCLAFCRQQNAQYLRALERYDVVQVLLPHEALIPYQRGVVFNFMRRPRDAEHEFSRAIELDPQYALAYRDRGQIRAWLGNWKGAEADYTAALERGWSAIQIHSLRAVARERLHDADGAAGDIKAAQELAPKTEWDYLVRGCVRMKRGNARGALEDFEQASTIHPESLFALQNQAHILAEKLDDLPAALEAVTKASSLYPEFAPARIGRAVILARLARRDEAIKEAEKALLMSDDPEVIYQAGCVYALTSKTHPDDRKRALDLLRRAFKGGYTNLKLLRQDHDLDVLRSQSEFVSFERAISNLFAR
ncbi:MAG TPA: tetratricopeptide repeat protein, partial [Gemmata sp.]|nr:tetratricopeptide repeat protein [Gemmata sp.]